MPQFVNRLVGWGGSQVVRVGRWSSVSLVDLFELKTPVALGILSRPPHAYWSGVVWHRRTGLRHIHIYLGTDRNQWPLDNWK